MSQRLPLATYRLQFEPSFTFSDALALLPYLKKMRISHIYASPVSMAVPGSTHGYNVCDPTCINPELGTEAEFINLLEAVKENQMGWIQDIVPNHMAFDFRNPYIFDILLKGPQSSYAAYFDIDWNHPQFGPKLMVPFLGDTLENCLQQGQLSLALYNNHICLQYYQARYPISYGTYQQVAKVPNLEALQQQPTTETQQHLSQYNTTHPENRDRMRHLLQQQNYVLTHWKQDTEKLNFRRFFTISGLICVAIENPKAFDLVHRYVLEKINDGLINGLRIDHIDGLHDPEAYLNTLRHKAPNAYIVAEKILEGDETIPETWPIEGTTGYDALTQLNTALCKPQAKQPFEQIYQELVPQQTNLKSQKFEQKAHIANTQMKGDLDNLCAVVRAALPPSDANHPGLREALQAYLVHFPVYRSYITPQRYTTTDAQYIQQALQAARTSLSGVALQALDLLQDLLSPHTHRTQHHHQPYIQAIQRIQQFTGPLMAKGLEDTLFYQYNKHVALNEVGGWPGSFGCTTNDLHYQMQMRNANQKQAMNGTATHDTKRGEDTRARLQVLTEIPQLWAQWVQQLQQSAQPHISAIDPNDAYLYVQTLIGTLPHTANITQTYKNRITDYLIKATREAKQNTNWENPNQNYEQALENLVEHTLNPEQHPDFVKTLTQAVQAIAWPGFLNTLTQTVLKCTLPGIPDVYRGTEGFDFSLVDPDNRRPVGFEALNEQLHSFYEASFALQSLLTPQPNPALKHYILHRCLRARHHMPHVFLEGTYSPIAVSEQLTEQIFAFERTHNQQMALVVVSRFMHQTHPQGQYQSTQHHEAEITLSQPQTWQGKKATEVFSGNKTTIKPTMPLGQMLPMLPVAVWLIE